MENNKELSEWDQIVKKIGSMAYEQAPLKQPTIVNSYHDEDTYTTIYNFRFLSRFDTIRDYGSKKQELAAVFEELQAIIFDDETRINLITMNTGRTMHEPNMCLWAIEFDNGRVTHYREPSRYNLNPERPCYELIQFIKSIAEKPPVIVE